MRVALYIRRSTRDLQPDSLAAQEELLRAYAAAHAHEVLKVYSDTASGRSTRKRTAFDALIDDVKSGAPFDAVLVRDVSRWSRAENTDEAGYYEFICRSHGVAVIYVEETFSEDGSPYSLLMKALKRTMAAEFSVERAQMVRASHARVVRQGFWPLGSVPYGLRRVLVDELGKELQTLGPGDRKALSNQRVKFAPGDPVQVGIVQRIFDRYGSKGMPMPEIAEELNREDISGTKGGRWSAAQIAHILQNEAYAGTLVYRMLDGDTPSMFRNLRGSDSERIVRCENAHPAIVNRAVWDRAQARLGLSSHRKTDAMLLEDLHEARIRWYGGKRAPMEVITATELRGGYGRPDIEVITPKKIAAAIAELSEAIGEHMHVTSFEGGYLIDHLLHVGIKVSLPHARFGGLHWSFSFTGEECEDVLLGMAFSPPPVVKHVETFFFRSAGFRKRRTAKPVLDPRGSSSFARFPANAPLFEHFQHAIRFRGKRAEEILLTALEGRTRVSLAEIADELSWPVTSTRTLYRKLELRGEAVPTLKNSRVGKRLSVICPHCLRRRSLTPEVVLTLKTEVCFECLHRPPIVTPNKLVAVCPCCGAKRLLTPAQVASRSAGLETLCRKCSMEQGRALGRAASRRSTS